LEVAIDLSMYPNLKELELEGVKLEAAPDVTHNPFLQVLNLFDNNIANCPDLKGSPCLKELWIGSQLSQFPDITPCPKLKLLELANNDITEIPYFEQPFRKLTKMNLQSNPIVEIFNLLVLFPRLEKLKIKGTRLLYIAPEICAQFSKGRVVTHYQSQLSDKYTCQSDFGRFVQKLMENSKTGCRAFYEKLEECHQSLIQEGFREECERRGIGVLPGLFENLSLLRYAVREALGVHWALVNQLPPEAWIDLDDRLEEWTGNGDAITDDLFSHFPLCADAIDYMKRALLVPK
jgi:hypothetical protein